MMRDRELIGGKIDVGGQTPKSSRLSNRTITTTSKISQLHKKRTRETILSFNNKLKSSKKDYISVDPKTSK